MYLRTNTGQQWCFGIKQHYGISNHVVILHKLSMDNHWQACTVQFFSCTDHTHFFLYTLSNELFYLLIGSDESFLNWSVHQPQVGYPFHWDETWRHQKKKKHRRLNTSTTELNYCGKMSKTSSLHEDCPVVSLASAALNKVHKAVCEAGALLRV